MTPYDRAWDMGSYAEYMWVCDGICHVVRIPDGRCPGPAGPATMASPCAGRSHPGRLPAGGRAVTVTVWVTGYCVTSGWPVRRARRGPGRARGDSSYSDAVQLQVGKPESWHRDRPAGDSESDGRVFKSGLAAVTGGKAEAAAASL